MSKLLHAELTYYLRGISYKIRNELRGGHAEEDYENALAYVFEQDGVPFQRQPTFRVQYRQQQVGEYRPDLLLADGKMLLELKATPQIIALHKAQVLSYLAVTNAELGLIMNFGGAEMEFQRLPNFLSGRQPQESHRSPLPADLLYPELTRAVLDALYQVHQGLGPGFLHPVYRRAAHIELALQGLNIDYLKELPLRFRGTTIATKATRLIHIEQKLLLAVVAVSEIIPAHLERLRWAMQETKCSLGLIANFYPSQLEFRFLRLAGSH